MQYRRFQQGRGTGHYPNRVQSKHLFMKKKRLSFEKCVSFLLHLRYTAAAA